MLAEFKRFEDKEDNMKPYLIWAFSFHFLIFLFLFIGENFSLFSQNKINSKEIEMLQSAVRVDVVSMPKFTIQELKTKVISEEKGDEKSEEKSEVVEPSPDKSNSFSSFLDTYSKKDIPKVKKKNRGKETTLDKKKLNSILLEGNKLSAGTSIVGDSLKRELTVFSEYVSALPNYVRPNWKLPTYLMEQGLKCRVQVFIASSGKIIKTQIFESSGVSEFDSRAIRALKETKGFPPPPSEIVTRLSSGDVILGFPI